MANYAPDPSCWWSSLCCVCVGLGREGIIALLHHGPLTPKTPQTPTLYSLSHPCPYLHSIFPTITHSSFPTLYSQLSSTLHSPLFIPHSSFFTLHSPVPHSSFCIPHLYSPLFMLPSFPQALLSCIPSLYSQIFIHLSSFSTLHSLLFIPDFPIFIPVLILAY